MITIANCVMDLNGQGQQMLSVTFKAFSHGENRKQKLAVIKHIDIHSGKLQPWHHGNIERVLGCSFLWRIARRFGIFADIRLVAFQKFVVVFRKIRPESRNFFVFLVKQRLLVDESNLNYCGSHMSYQW